MYEQLPIKMHIQMVQEGHCTIENEKKATTSLRTLSKKISELNDLKMALAERLTKMDRNKPEFFPIRSLVEYINPRYSQQQKFGWVVEHSGPMCVCIFEGENFETLVDPSNLKLRFVRINY